MFQRTPDNDRPTRSRSRRMAAGASLVAVVALLGASCGNDSDEKADTDNTESTTRASGVDGFEFTSPDGDYAVTFPSEPTAQPTPVQLPGGQTIEVPLQVASAATSEYTAAAITYPADAPVNDDADISSFGGSKRLEVVVSLDRGPSTGFGTVLDRYAEGPLA